MKINKILILNNLNNKILNKTNIKNLIYQMITPLFNL